MKNHSDGFSIIGLFKAFKISIRGLFILIKSEVNVIFILIISILMIGVAFFFRVSKYEWLVLLIVIFFVLFAEIINTTIEKIMDFVEPKYDEKVRDIKDLASGSVFLTVILSVIIGLIIFLPKILVFLF